MMSAKDKTILTVAVTGVLTDPEKFNVPVTPEQMADATKQAYDQGATIVHAHFRDQGKGLGAFPTWDLKTVGDILSAIKEKMRRLSASRAGSGGDDAAAPPAGKPTRTAHHSHHRKRIAPPRRGRLVPCVQVLL